MKKSELKAMEELIHHPYPLMFVTISGAHLYGFPSKDSDFDLRGAHILPIHEVVGLKKGPETVEKDEVRQGKEVDLVTHDISKYFTLMLKKNGYVLEQVLSPLAVRSSEEHKELIEITSQCVTRYHGHHYIGFSRNQWSLFLKETPHRIKPLLYIYRVLLTGIHLMRTGKVEANLLHLNEEFKLPFIHDLVKKKTEGAEKETLSEVDLEFHRKQVEGLSVDLEQAMEDSDLPEAPGAKDALNDLLIRLRMKHIS